MPRTLRLLACVCLPLLTIWLSAQWTIAAYGNSPTVLYVDRDAGGGTNDGGSWANAYTALQMALDTTNANGSSTFEIWVADGVYYPDLRTGQNSNLQTESFRINRNNVQLYGGFAGSETLRSQRDPAVHLTLLSGDIDNDNGGGDINTDGNFIAETSAAIRGSNAYHVLYLDGQTNEPLTSAIVLDGFIVTAGRANDIGLDIHGGGLYCAGEGVGKGCSPTITNVTFSGNRTMGAGGGMYNTGASGGASSPVLANVTFRGNRAQYGGGMANNANDGTSSPVLTNVTSSGNWADRSGGGMANLVSGSGTSSPQLVNVIMWGDGAFDDTEIAGGMPTISYSVIGQNGITGVGNFRGDPLLSSSADHGIGMLMFALLPGSRAIDTGDSAACAAPPVNNLDQRGVTRPQGGNCDIGAFESHGFTLIAAGGSPQETTIFSPFALPLAVLAVSADAEPLGPGGVITLTPPADGPGLSVTTPFHIATYPDGLTAATSVTANGIAGSFTVTATAAGVANPIVFSLINTPPLLPQARADVAAVLQDTPLLLDVLANDVPGTNQQLTMYTVTQPLIGALAAIEQNQVRFTPGAGFTGLVTFTATIHDGNSLASSAQVAVHVAAASETNGEPETLSLPDPASGSDVTVTVPAGTTEIEIPAGAITSTESPLSTYDLVYQEVNTPAPPPTSTLFSFGGRAFTLQMFVDAKLQTPYVFNVPIFVTLSYDPNTVTDTSRLELYYYDEGRQEWSKDGITILSVDTQNHNFRASIAHLTEFALGIKAPTGLDPNLEPQFLPQLFLPEVHP